MNAKTKGAARKARNSSREGAGAPNPAAKQGEEVSSPATQEPKAKTEPAKLYRVNCKVEITSLNNYEGFNGGRVCSRRCDDIVDPVSKEIRERRKCLPSCDSVYQRSPK